MDVEYQSHLGKIEAQLEKTVGLSPQHLIIYHSKIHIFMGST